MSDDWTVIIDLLKDVKNLDIEEDHDDECITVSHQYDNSVVAFTFVRGDDGKRELFDVTVHEE